MVAERRQRVEARSRDRERAVAGNASLLLSLFVWLLLMRIQGNFTGNMAKTRYVCKYDAFICHVSSGGKARKREKRAREGGGRDRERQRETERERERERERDRERETERETERQRARERERQRETERLTHAHTFTQTHTQHSTAHIHEK